MQWLWLLLLRPVLLGVWALLNFSVAPKFILGLVGWPILLLIDLFACCNPRGGAGCPCVPVLVGRAAGACSLFRNSRKKSKTKRERCQSGGAFYFGTLCSILLGVMTVMLWRAYMVDRLPNTALYWSLLILCPCLSATFGWLLGKEAVLQWIPDGVERVKKQIRRDANNRHLVEMKKAFGEDRIRLHAKWIAAGYQAHCLDVWSRSFQFVLCLPARLLTLPWDVANQATLLKSWWKQNPHIHKCCCCSCFRWFKNRRAKKNNNHEKDAHPEPTPLITEESTTALLSSPFPTRVAMVITEAEAWSYERMHQYRLGHLPALARLAFVRYQRDGNNNASERLILQEQCQNYLADVQSFHEAEQEQRAFPGPTDPVAKEWNIPAVENWRSGVLQQHKILDLLNMSGREGLPLEEIAPVYERAVFALRQGATYDLDKLVLPFAPLPSSSSENKTQLIDSL